MSDKKMADLPQSNSDFWEGEKILNTPKAIALCSTHTRDNWQSHYGYIDNHDGTISCKFCPWGTSLGGRYRLVGERILDLMTLAR